MNNIEKQVKKEDMPLATELLHELKAVSKRLFIAFVVVLILWMSTIVGFITYLSLPNNDCAVTQEAEDSGQNKYVGGDYKVDTTDSTNNTQAD